MLGTGSGVGVGFVFASAVEALFCRDATADAGACGAFDAVCVGTATGAGSFDTGASSCAATTGGGVGSGAVTEIVSFAEALRPPESVATTFSGCVPNSFGLGVHETLPIVSTAIVLLGEPDVSVTVKTGATRPVVVAKNVSVVLAGTLKPGLTCIKETEAGGKTVISTGTEAEVP